MHRPKLRAVVVTILSGLVAVGAFAQESFLAYTDSAGLVRADLDGSNFQILTTNGSDRDPRISPDGSTIVFWRGFDLYLMDGDGANTRLLLAGAASGLVRNLCWSPDGSQIAYAEGAVRSTRLNVINADGTARQTLYAMNDFAQAPHCDWSLDDEIYIPFGQSANAAALEIFACQADGSGCRQVTSNPGSALAEFPRLSSARDRVFYSTRPNPFGQPRTIRRSGLDGSGEIAITQPGSNAIPAGAFDGRLYYTDRLGGDTQVYSVLEDGSDLRQESSLGGGVSVITDVFVRSCSFGPGEGPVTFVRGKGAPAWESLTWASCGGPGTLVVESSRVASARIYLNGELLFGPGEFNDGMTDLSAAVQLIEGDNVLDVRLAGRPGGTLTFEFLPDS